MPEVHLPQVEDYDARTSRHSRGKSVAKILLEVVLISGGVFLGIAGEQWRDISTHRELAHAALERFRTEVVNNQKAVTDVQDYHTRLNAVVKAYLRAKTKAERDAINFDMHGVQPVIFDHTAWDVALATQSLAYIDSDLVFSLSEVYNRQAQYRELTGSLVQAMFQQPPAEGQDVNPFLQKVDIFFDDALGAESRILRMYDDLLPKINQALSKQR